MTKKNRNQEDIHVRLDQETFDWQWVNLMLEARDIGLSPDDVREFLKVAVDTDHCR